MEGYAKVARLMGSQKEYAILRRFSTLNIQRLLYMQAEIVHLDSELVQLVARDSVSAGRQHYAKDWWSLSQGETDEDLEQWKKFTELSEKLDRYSKNIWQISQLLNELTKFLPTRRCHSQGNLLSSAKTASTL